MAINLDEIRQANVDADEAITCEPSFELAQCLLLQRQFDDALQRRIMSKLVFLIESLRMPLT